MCYSSAELCSSEWSYSLRLAILDMTPAGTWMRWISVSLVDAGGAENGGKMFPGCGVCLSLFHIFQSYFIFILPQSSSGVSSSCAFVFTLPFPWNSASSCFHFFLLCAKLQILFTAHCIICNLYILEEYDTWLNILHSCFCIAYLLLLKAPQEQNSL